MKHKLLSMLFACSLFTTTFAQPIIKRQKDLGGNNLDFFTCMAITKDGGKIVGGYSRSNISGQKTDSSRGGFDYWVVKLDRTNKIEWDKTIGGKSTDILTALQQTNDGGYILGGFSISNASGEKTQKSKGSYDYWIVKLDSLGNIQFDKTIGGSSFDDLFAIQQTSDSGYILGGYSFSGKSGDKTEDSRGGLDYWIVKTDSKGNVQWDKTLGGSDEDGLSSLQQTSDGGYIAGGYSFSNKSGDKSENAKGLNDFWIVKLDKNGNIQFDKTIGGNATDDLTALQQTNDGGYILGGNSNSPASGDKTEKGRGDQDYWVVKLSANGRIQWDKTIGGTNLDIPTSLQQTRDSGYILGGRSFSNVSFEKSENTRGINDDDYWVVKLDRRGKKQWDKTIGGTELDECYSVKETSRDHYVAGGWSLSNASGDKTSNIKGDKDYWLVDIAFNTGTQTVEATTENNIAAEKIPASTFIAYPNPAKDVLHIMSESKATMVLSDASGKIVLTQNINGNADINIHGLQPGVYFLTNQTTGDVRKVVIER